MITLEETLEYIRVQNIEHNANIIDFNIGDTVLDVDKRECLITDKSVNSLEIWIEAKDIKQEYSKRKGISHKEWFYIKDFNKRFKKK